MKNEPFHTIEEYPIMLSADDLAAILGISRTSAYKLMQSKGFPALTLGKRVVTPRDRLIAWINTQLDGGTDEEGGQIK